MSSFAEHGKVKSGPDLDQTTPLIPASDRLDNNAPWPSSTDVSPWRILGGSPDDILSEEALDGSWYLQLRPVNGNATERLCGPLRIQRASGDVADRFGAFVVSGDLYSHDRAIETFPEPITEYRLDVGRNWYPQAPWSDYRGHLKTKKDTSATYDSGNLRFAIAYYTWDRNWYSNYLEPAQGHFIITCERQVVTHSSLPQPTLRLTGEAEIGETRYGLIATKTSPFYRGCHVEVDVMRDRYWIAGAYRHDGSWESFTGVFRRTGFDILLAVSETDILRAEELSRDQLGEYLKAYREFKPDGRSWRLWMLVASRLDEIPGDTEEPWFGIMFDKKVSSASWRNGVAVFYDPLILGKNEEHPLVPGLEDKRLGDVDVAFLRTALHEAGHAFSLMHPVDDFWVEAGRTIMNRTGDVKKEATAEHPFPHNIEFAFDPQHALFLIHSPDPKVAPGWSRGYQSDASWPEYTLKKET
ncbi:MAG TPA: hypothetical protein VGA50_06855 [Kiloniellales bacterium]